jgi:hypothetical protein
MGPMSGGLGFHTSDFKGLRDRGGGGAVEVTAEDAKHAEGEWGVSDIAGGIVRARRPLHIQRPFRSFHRTNFVSHRTRFVHQYQGREQCRRPESAHHPADGTGAGRPWDG